MDSDDERDDARVAAVPKDVRDKLLRELLLLAERFDAEHDLGLDLFGRLTLIDQVLASYADALAPPEPKVN